jgi:hypothetical protein
MLSLCTVRAVRFRFDLLVPLTSLSSRVSLCLLTFRLQDGSDGNDAVVTSFFVSPGYLLNRRCFRPFSGENLFHVSVGKIHFSVR